MARNAPSGHFLPVLAFTVAYSLIAAWTALRTGNTEFTFYVVVLWILIAIVGLVHRAVRLTTGALWALSVWGLLHMLGGLVTLPSGRRTTRGRSCTRSG